jgi:hypothetical protein
VEATDTEMHYADADLVAIVGGLGDRDRRQRCAVQFHDTFTTGLTVPGMRSASSVTATRIPVGVEGVVYVTLHMLA